MSLVTLLFIVLTCAQLNEGVTVKPAEECSHSDWTKVSSCATILFRHIEKLKRCNLECSVFTSIIQCVYRANILEACANASVRAADRLFSVLGFNCTFERLKRSCLPDNISAGAKRTTLRTPYRKARMAEFNRTMKGLRCFDDDLKHVTPCLTADMTYVLSVRTKCTVDCKLFGEVVRCVNMVGLSKICQEDFQEDLDNLLRKFGPKNCTFQRIVKLCPKAPKVGDPVKAGGGGREHKVYGHTGGGAVGAVYKQCILTVMTAALHVVQLMLPGRLLV